MPITPSADAVLALAPDGASAKAARGLAMPARWPLLGADGTAVWGECQGSGSKPYQVQVDLSGPTFRCSCPSRKFPCKHGLAVLLLRAEQAGAFGSAPPPAWVTAWLGMRAEKAAKAEQKAQQARERIATGDEGGSEGRADERDAGGSEAPAPDTQAAQQREARRWQRIEQAGQDLQRWLADLAARGLGGLGTEARGAWETMARRMVDGQAPGLGQRIRDAAHGIAQGEDWPQRLLERLGLLQLACDALARREHLDPPQQADLRTLAGWPQDRTEVLAGGKRVADRWTVLGQVVEPRDDRLVERRIWLHGQASGRRALLLDHAFRSRAFEGRWQVGDQVAATLAFFPGASGLRALHDASAASAEAGPDAEAGPGLELGEWPHPAAADEWQAVARRVAACPWVDRHPVVLAEAVPIRIDGRSLLACADRALSLALPDIDLWTLLAASGGRPLSVMGEWDGRRLLPLSAWSGRECRWTRRVE